MTRRLLALAGVLTSLAYASDPSPGIFWTKAEVRRLACTRLSQSDAHERYPGEIPEMPAREIASGATDALICEQRIIEPSERPARDEAILSTLTRLVGELTELAGTAVPPGTVWHVDAYYPDLRVAAKISTAAKTNLVERGQAVSDRMPVLAAADISVLSHLTPGKALPAACARYAAEHSLAPRHAVLSLTILDARETQLHAGVCLEGGFRWLK